MMITSKNNEKIKYINSLKDKKYRDRHGKFILEGIKLVDEHISSGIKTPEFIVLCKDLLEKASGGIKLLEKIYNFDNVLEVDEKTFKQLTDTETPQGILIVLDKNELGVNDAISSMRKNEKFVILDKIADAGNMGTIIRSAVAFNVKNVICVKGCTDVYSSKVIRSTMGAINKVNIYNLTLDELKLLKTEFKQNGYKLVGTDLKASCFLNEKVPVIKATYILGNEANGVSEEVKALCDEFVKIPMEEVQESLNVATATSILLYDLYVRGE